MADKPITKVVLPGGGRVSAPPPPVAPTAPKPPAAPPLTVAPPVAPVVQEAPVEEPIETQEPVASEPTPIEVAPAASSVVEMTAADYAPDEISESQDVTVAQAGFDDESIGLPTVDFFSGEKGFSYRLAFPRPDQIAYANVHFLDGYFVCHSTPTKRALCCQRLGDPRPRCATPVVKYYTNNRGEAKKPLSAEVMVWVLSGDKFSALRTIHKQTPLHEWDVIATCTEKQYQKFTFAAARGVLWRSENELAQQVWQEASALVPRLRAFVGKKLTHDELLERLGQAPPPSEMGAPSVGFESAVGA